MQYIKFADSVSDSTKFQIKEGSELDSVIKECSEEVSPFRVGVLIYDKHIPVGNMLPAIFFPIAYVPIAALFG